MADLFIAVGVGEIWSKADWGLSDYNKIRIWCKRKIHRWLVRDCKTLVSLT